MDPVFLEALGEERLQELGTVLPTFGRRVSAGATLLQSERYRVHRALRAVLEHLARRRPLLLALDDLHWADAATTELLAFCCGVLPLAAVVIAAAFRPRQAPAPLTMALAAAERQGNVERLELGPLSLEETRALLGPDVGTEAAVVLYRESGGNPFYLEQLARVPRAASPADGRSQTTVGTAIPPAVIAALGEELVALSTPARRLLQGAAVVGDPFEPDLAADAAGLTEAEALALLDELIEIDLGATDRRSPPLPFSPPDRSPSRVRVGRGGVAARSPRTGGPGSRARPSSRAPNGPNNARGRRLYPVRASSALTVDGYHCCLPEREGSRPRSVDGRWR